VFPRRGVGGGVEAAVGFVEFEQGVLLEFLFDISVQFEIAHLQQLDRLL
jgi:hypothetical protein